MGANHDSTTVCAQTPALTLDKTAVPGSSYADVGELTELQLWLTNTGNVTLARHDRWTTTDDLTCPATPRRHGSISG